MREFLNKEGTKSVIATIISILIGLVAGAVVILIVGITDKNLGIDQALQGVSIVFGGFFRFSSTNIGDMLFRAVPIIMTGLSVSLAYKTGLFNIGASGQFLAGTTATLFIALSIPTTAVPAWIVWILAFVGGVLAGALWGAIPGVLKAFLNINEVLACIMTNWLAANLATWLFELSNLQNQADGKTNLVWETSHNGVSTAKMGLDKLFAGSSQVDGAIIIVIVIAVIVYVLLTKTTFGYELKACGSNRHAARYAGIKDKRSIVLSMAIAGALAGAGASLYYLSGSTQFAWKSAYMSLPGEGFTGIAVALLGACNPIANIFTGMFMSSLNIIGKILQEDTFYNDHIIDVIIAVIVYLAAFSLLIKIWLTKRFKKTEDKRIPDVAFTSENIANASNKHDNNEKAETPAENKPEKGGDEQ